MAASALQAALGVSQPTMSRALTALGDDVLRIGAARSIHYAWHDRARGVDPAPVWRVGADGRLMALGQLHPACPEGWVMVQADGRGLHSQGLPWWLQDMRPQGFLGRAFNQHHGTVLGLPERLGDWQDRHVMQALLQQGDDLPGNLLIGAEARERFVTAHDAAPLPRAGRARAYGRLAAAAARGEATGSSAGGEQPKFCAWAAFDEGPAHVIVKFSAPVLNAVSQRWSDLLLAEHLALQVLQAHGVPAARSALWQAGPQRFLEVQRFDRQGARGRHALHSIGVLDAEFVGGTDTAWPGVTRSLMAEGVVQAGAQALVDRQWAFGCLIGNTDMHGGNLAFLADAGRPYALAPAYDMTPMAFAPGAGGDLPQRQLAEPVTDRVPPEAWRHALAMAQDWLQRLRADARLSEGFAPCLPVLAQQLARAGQRVDRLA